MKIEVRPGEPIAKALKRLRRACEDAGIPDEIRARNFYVKPSEQRRLRVLRQRMHKFRDVS